MSVAALVLAAGRGERLGHDLPKAFVALGGKPLLLHALEAMAATPEVDLVVPVVGASELGVRGRLGGLEAALAAIPKLTAPVAGGAERQDSVRCGVESLPPGVILVAVHDAARPLVRPSAVSRVIRCARRDGAAILATPVYDTIKCVRDDRVVSTPDRSECYAAQTPQVFRLEILREALEKARAEGRVGTDDAQLVEWLGLPVTVVEGDPENIKVTGPEDLAIAERWLRERTGRGDVGRRKDDA